MAASRAGNIQLHHSVDAGLAQKDQKYSLSSLKVGDSETGAGPGSGKDEKVESAERPREPSERVAVV